MSSQPDDRGDAGQPPEEPADSLDAGLRAAFGAPKEDDSGARTVLEHIERVSGGVPKVFLRPGRDGPTADDGAAGAGDVRRSGSHYELLGELARGGVGIVLRGHDADLGRDVALKVLQAQHAHRPEVLQRFVEEAQIGGQLQHPGIVPVYEMGMLDGARPYFTMKLVKGRTLASMLDERAAPAVDQHDFLRIFEAVCQTLAYAHSRGVVHRDVKPANVMVGSFGEVQLVDWGLAKVLGTRAEGVQPPGAAAADAPGRAAEPGEVEDPVIATIRSGDASDSASQSVVGSVLGTPAYMSPEQARGEVDQLDERSDVFALGAMLCTILTGEPPYVGERNQVLSRAAQADLDDAFSRLDGCGADPALVSLARECLTDARDARPRNAEQVAARIHAYLVSVDERARAAQLAAAEARVRAEDERRARRLTLALALAVIAVLAVGAGGWALVQEQRAERQADARRALDATLARARAELDLEQWDGVLAALDPVAVLAADVPEAPARLAEAKRLRARARAALEEQRLGALNAELFGALEELRRPDHHEIYPPQYARMDTEFSETFAANALPVEALDVEQALALLRERDEPEALAALLDEWSNVRRLLSLEDEAERLTLLADELDPDPQRTALRTAMAARDLDVLRAFVDSERLEQLSPATLRLVAHAMEVAGDTGRQIEVLSRAQKVHRQDFLTNLQLARMLVRADRIEEALPYYEVALALRPDSVETRHLFGIYLHRFADRVDAAAELFEQSLELGGDDAHLWYHLGQARLTQERLDEAVAALERSVELEPDYLEAHGSLGEAHLVRGDLPRAVAALRNAHGLEPGDAETLVALGSALIVSGETGEGERLVEEAIAQDPLNPKYHHKLGWAFSATGDWQRAQEALEDSVEAEPTRDALDLLADARAYQGDFAGAIEACDQSLALGPSLTALLRGGALANQVGDLETALARFRAALELDWEEPFARRMYTGLLTATERWADLEAHYTERVDRAPDSGADHNNLAWLLATCPDAEVRDLERALEHIDRAIELAPDSESYWNTLALVQLRREAWSEARRAATTFEASGLTAELNTLIEALAECRLDNHGRARELYAGGTAAPEASREPILLELREELRLLLEE